jgi:tetratricopeptide (TPR) repeat protein
LTLSSPGRWRRRLLLIFAIALALRLLHLFQIRSAPFFTLLMGDSRAYDTWAQAIAGGDWIGHDVFYQAPLYPYFLGIVYSAFGHSLTTVRVLQAAIGSMSCVLLADATRRVFDDVTGTVAGVMLALWAPAIFFDSVLQKSVLDVFFVCLIVWLIAQIACSRNTRLWLWTGLAVGGLSLTRENAMVFVAVLAIWALMRPERWRGAALFLAGLAIVLAPVAVRNSRMAGGGFYVTTSQFGPNLYIGNNPRADGTYASLRYGRGAPEFERQDATEIAQRALGRTLSPADVSAYWTDQALEFMTSQPGDWLKLVGRKFALLWNATEVVDTEAQESYADWSWPLRILGPVATFGLLVPLALLGVVLTWNGRQPIVVLAALAASYGASVVLFYVFARYRYPLVPFLILFAAAALVAVALNVRRVSKTWFQPKRLAWPAYIVVGATAVFANWPIIPHAWMRAVSESNIGVALQAEGRYDDAITHYQKSIEDRPGYAPALNNLATAYRASGKTNEAIATYQRALQAQPDFPDAEFNLGNALLDQGHVDEAVSRFQSALRALGESADVHNNLGTAYAAKGRMEDALREFRRAVELDPASAAARRNLGDVLAAKGDRSGAIEELRQATQRDPSNGDAHYDLGLALLEQGATEEAAAEFRIAVQRLPSSPEAHNNLGIALGSLGRLDDAIAQFQEALRLRPDMEDAKNNLALAMSAKRSRRNP